jgi:hypothetical protein
MPLIQGNYANILTPVSVDSSGRIITVLPGAVTPVAIYSKYQEIISSAALAAGYSMLNGVNIAAGYYAYVQWISGMYNGTTLNVRCRVSVYDGATYYHLENWSPMMSLVARGVSCGILLDAGEQFRVSIYNATLNDRCEFAFLGYLIKKV